MLDVQVELSDEFDRNFERKAFFAQAWQRRKGTYRNDKPLLLNTGRLRRSITSSIKDNRIVFSSTEPYADIHNRGGTIVVTRRMKGYFWHKFRQAAKGLGRDGTLSSEAEFYRAMAMKPVGSRIVIPRRQFIGFAPKVEQAVRSIIEQRLSEFFNSDKFQIDIRQ